MTFFFEVGKKKIFVLTPPLFYFDDFMLILLFIFYYYFLVFNVILYAAKPQSMYLMYIDIGTRKSLV